MPYLYGNVSYECSTDLLLLLKVLKNRIWHISGLARRELIVGFSDHRGLYLNDSISGWDPDRSPLLLLLIF